MKKKAQLSLSSSDSETEDQGATQLPEPRYGMIDWSGVGPRWCMYNDMLLLRKYRFNGAGRDDLFWRRPEKTILVQQQIEQAHQRQAAIQPHQVIMIISSLLWNKGDTTITWRSLQGDHEIKLSAPLGHLNILSDKSGFLVIEDTEKADPNNATIWNADGSIRCKLTII